jgi:hypothetical protein
VRRHRGPGRAAYVRLEHGVVDLVDVEAVAAGDLAAADSGFATLRAGPAAVRLLRKVSARGEVLLRDLADLTAVGADRIPARLDAPAARGRTAVAAVQRRLDAGPVPEPVPVGELLGGGARLAAGAARASATARAHRWGAPVLVVLTASAAPLADGLETDLQKAAVDVLRLDQPEPARLLRSLARGLLDRAVVVVTDPPARWPVGPHLRLTSGDRSELVTAVLHQLR